MYSSSARKRSAPTIAHGGPKRHQSVYWKSSLEAGPSGTGITDTRSRSPERSIFRKHATIPRNMHRLPQDKLPQEDRNYLIRLGLDERSQMARGLSEKAAKKNLEEKWTTYVEEKYGSREVMGEGGLVKVDDGGKCTVEADDDDDDDESGETEDDGKVETEDDGEVETEDEVEEAPVATNRNVASAQEELAAEFARDAPDVGQKDVRLCEMMNELTTKIVRFGKMFNKKHFRATPAEFLDGLLRKENEQLIRYIGCLAMGGKNGRAGWEELVNMPATREALVCGIMGRALKEHIFSDLYFGASEQLKLDLIDKEKTMRDDDGFSRNRERAKLIQRKMAKHGDSRLRLEHNLMTLRFVKLLAPFYDLKTDCRLPITIEMALREIITSSTKINRLMRLAPDVVYYWTSTFKDEEFRPENMECYNLHEMILNSPFEREVVHHRERAVLREGANEERKEAIVKIVCFPGLEAYRKGGGALAEEELARGRNRPDHAPPDVQAARKRNGESYKATDGYRSKTICKSVVYLVWDKQRLLTREAGTSRHIDAVRSGDMSRYTKDYEGFVELYDLATQQWEQELVRASPSRLSSFLGR